MYSRKPGTFQERQKVYTANQPARWIANRRVAHPGNHLLNVDARVRIREHLRCFANSEVALSLTLSDALKMRHPIAGAERAMARIATDGFVHMDLLVGRDRTHRLQKVGDKRDSGEGSFHTHID